jgi:hypothetical protein
MEVRDTINVSHGYDANHPPADRLSIYAPAILLLTHRTKDRSLKQRLAAVALICVAVAACGATTDATATTDTVSESPTTTVVTTTTEPPTTTTTTVAPTTTVATTSEADKEAITMAYEIVFSSETTYEEKAPLIDDPIGLEETVLKYTETGESMGGVSLEARTITVDGPVAKVIYDLLFGGTPTYPDLTGDAVLIDGTWKVTRTMFCSIMASARVGCPAS